MIVVYRSFIHSPPALLVFISVGIHETTYELLKNILALGVPYQERDHCDISYLSAVKVPRWGTFGRKMIVRSYVNNDGGFNGLNVLVCLPLI